MSNHYLKEVHNHSHKRLLNNNALVVGKITADFHDIPPVALSII